MASICLHTDEKGMQNIALATSRGASLIIVDKFVRVPDGVAAIKVKNIRESYALLAKIFIQNALIN